MEISPRNPRILRVTFRDSVSQDVFSDDVAINVEGFRSGSWVLNEATVSIYNIRKELRDRLTTRYQPTNQVRIGAQRGSIFIDAGRESTGFSRVFEGHIRSITPTDLPDIALNVQAVTSYLNKTDISSTNFRINTVRGISEQIAQILGLRLNFNATDMPLRNYNYVGDQAGLVKFLDELVGISAFIDNNQLVVLDDGLESSPFIHQVNSRNGMVGVPTLSEAGVNVRFLWRPNIRVGSIIEVESRVYPGVNGQYVISNLKFNLTNRDHPFYYEAFAVRRI